MLEEYTLFLDESTENDLLLISGVIVKNSALADLNNSIYEIKKLIWDERYITTENPILHSTEFNVVKNNRKNRSLKGVVLTKPYKEFAKKSETEILDIFNKVYTKLSTIIKNLKITTLGCVIDKKRFKDLYCLSSYGTINDDWYDIGLQELIESYSHFLCSVNGIGTIIYESRNNSIDNSINSPDVSMFDNFCKIKANNKGISFLNSKTMSRIRSMNIISKQDDNAGLQLADFVTFNFIKLIKIVDDKVKTDFMKRIHIAAYNGGIDLTQKDSRAYWGLKFLPLDFEKIESLTAERKTLIRANANLKNERNRQINLNNKLKGEKDKLEEDIKKLKEEIETLKEQIKLEDRKIV